MSADELRAPDPVSTRRAFPKEAALFALLFVLAYAGLAALFHYRAARLFTDLDRAFDADLGSWTIDIARPQGPHARTRIHPLSVLLLNPLGSTLRVALQHTGVEFAARLAAQLLCALAGGLAVGAFRVLLERLAIATARARLWTLLFGTSATQIVFSSLPESYAFSALSLLLVFLVAAGPRAVAGRSLAAGVASFGITFTNLVAVALARWCTTGSLGFWRRVRSCAAQVGLVLALAAALSLLQHALFRSAEIFFVPRHLSAAYESSFFVPDTAVEELERIAGVLSHFGFAALAAPRLLVGAPGPKGPMVDFADIALLTPTPVSALHWLLWALLLFTAGRGLWRARSSAPPVIGALGLWLLFLFALSVVFGSSYFLYSGHWVFALLALGAWGVEQHASRGGRAGAALATLVGLQLLANGHLVWRILQVFHP